MQVNASRSEDKYYPFIFEGVYQVRILGEHLRIAAVSDIHCPRYLKELEIALKGLHEPDILLFAGDMIEAERFAEYRKIADVLEMYLNKDVPAIGCVGNDEQGIDPFQFRDIVGDRIVLLDGNTFVHSTSQGTLGIIGVPLITNVKKIDTHDIAGIFKDRIANLKTEVVATKQTCDRTILLQHYSPLELDSFPSRYSWWLSKVLEGAPPDIIIHGHIHYATNPEVCMSATKILNVAFPATGKITEIDL